MTYIFLGIFILILSGVILIGLNLVVRRTHWYNNIFIYTKQFDLVSGSKYEIVNLGSNTDRFAFFYESVFGQNWSTGGEGLKESFEILKHNFSAIKKNGIVILPVNGFCSIAEDSKFDTRRNIQYYAKILKATGYSSVVFEKCIYRKAMRFIRYPLLIYPKSMRYIIKDTEKDNRLLCLEQAMQYDDLITDADKWFSGYQKEFGIIDFSDPLTDSQKKCYNKTVNLLSEVIDFCLERNLKPVIISPPVTNIFSSRFPSSVRELHVYSFIRQANKQNVLYLDYYYDERFQDPQYYCNSYFLNLRGRKIFTKQVLHDLGLDVENK